MNLIIICSWSCFIIFASMVWSKYYWTRPPYAVCALFMGAGVFSTGPSLICNYFLSRETDFWVFSSNKLYSFMGFFIGAGLGEEFWKFSSGIMTLIILQLGRVHVREADCVLGFVSLGLAFAAVENLISYSYLEFEILIGRGILAVPVHAGMGLIHGVAVNSARARMSVWPLLRGYLCAVTIHTFWDTWDDLIPFVAPKLIMGVMATILIIGGWQHWRMIPELKDRMTSL